MKTIPLPALWLRVRLLGANWNPVAAGAALLLVAAVALLLWLTQARDLLARQHELARRMATLPPPAVKAAPPATANQSLAAFYDALGERRYAEQQVKTLFGLASKSGLVLREGEYKIGYDRNARVYTYQVNLPLKGSYRALWEFSMDALLAIPFASLDEISFRRDAIGEANVEARMRLTLYLTDAPRGGGQ